MLVIFFSHNFTTFSLNLTTFLRIIDFFLKHFYSDSNNDQICLDVYFFTTKFIRRIVVLKRKF